MAAHKQTQSRTRAPTCLRHAPPSMSQNAQLASADADTKYRCPGCTVTAATSPPCSDSTAAHL